MGYDEVTGLPMRVFWQLSGYVDRVLADEARIQLELLTASNSMEATLTMREHLAKVAPEPFVMDEYAVAMATAVRDEAGIADLKSML